MHSSLTQLGNGLDIAEKEVPNETIVNETNIDSINVTNSEDVHFGPRFIATTINYIETTPKRSQLKYIIVFATLLILVAAILLFHFLLPEPRKPSTETPKQTTTDEPQTFSPSTDPTSSTTEGPPSCSLPQNWLYPYVLWSIKPPLRCENIINKQPWTISIDSVSQCEDVYALRDLQESSGLHHNFYISLSGTVYTGHDWFCSPEYNTRYSRTNIIIAICGKFNYCHQLALEKLISVGVDYGKIRPQYNVIPECCRGYPNKRGPGKEVNQYLASASDPIKFPNTRCIAQPTCV